MSDEQSSGDKPFEPTAKKLEDARRKGEIPRSVDLNTAASYFGLLLGCVLAGPVAVEGAGTAMLVMIDRADTLGGLILDDGGRSLAGGLMLRTGMALAPLLLLPTVTVLIGLVALRGFAPSITKLAPKLSRISPVSNAKNKFGREGLFEFAKSFVKLVVICIVLGVFLVWQAPTMLSAVSLDAGQATMLMGRLTIGFLGTVLLVSVVIGTIDTIWQRAEHMRKNRMSHKEMTDEQKNAEGDAHMKQERRQRGYDIATNRMMIDVPKADVVIVNPEHYAVALKWSRKPGAAPVCVAKGVDEVAARIRAAAAEAGVPLHRDPRTARSLHAGVSIGEEIDPAHYGAVAAAIRFADRMRKHGRKVL